MTPTEEVKQQFIKTDTYLHMPQIPKSDHTVLYIHISLELIGLVLIAV